MPKRKVDRKTQSDNSVEIWTAGHVDAPSPLDGIDMWASGIDVSRRDIKHGNAIIFYGDTEEESMGRRDFALSLYAISAKLPV